MAKIGIPEVSITFKEAGVNAIQRGERGTVALVLADAVSLKPTRLTSVKDIPETLNDFNKDQIKKTFLGYVTPPREVLIYVQSEEELTFDKAFEYLEQAKWDWLAIPSITPEETAEVVSKITNLRNEEGKKVKAVLPNVTANSEGIVNFTSDEIKVGERIYTTAEYCGRIAGLIAGTPLQIAPTYAPLPEVESVKFLNKTDRAKAVDNGEFIIYHDGKKVKTARGVNSYTESLGEGKANLPKALRKIKIVEAIDLIYSDIITIAEDNYIGKVPNSYDNKCLLITAIKEYFLSLERDNILASGTSNIELDIESQAEYLKSNGIEVADLSEKELKEADTGSKVFLKANIKVLDAIEDIELPIII